ncbi:unnamed protein product [Protopolystoma xenopodis]|uniref:Uncharacterized protein n=1 Tax=Protopolystoma xenopodis TaxID=117903 RepID=A0A3S5FDA2_9PLAT|nr:unnamed protein product [Protopolystoma xenopodis]
MADMAGMQRAKEALQHTARSLLSQHSAAEHRLADYADQTGRLKGSLTELTAKVAEERAIVEQLRTSLSQQQNAVKV